MQKGVTSVALGFDEGLVLVRLAKDEPVVSMDTNSGKVVCFTDNSEVLQYNLKGTYALTIDGCSLSDVCVL